MENKLRNLLRLERKKNEVLNEEYLQQQKKNVELQTKLQSMENENGKLVKENEKFRNAYSYISHEHDYV